MSSSFLIGEDTLARFSLSHIAKCVKHQLPEISVANGFEAAVFAQTRETAAAKHLLQFGRVVKSEGEDFHHGGPVVFSAGQDLLRTIRLFGNHGMYVNT